MYTIIGKQRKTGNYNGRDYDNTVLHCTYEQEGCEGYAVAFLKIKTELLTESVNIGETITPYYDRFGNVVSVRKE